jgi:hypothetical protein
MPLRRWVPLLLAALLGLFALLPRLAGGTPLYSARAGRTCDNCHLTPNDWVNPSLSERKCTLSCQSCHVDPSGGGMRNAAGRFYGRSTLPLVATSPRPTQDWDRNWLFHRMDKATTYTHDLPLGPNDLAQVGEEQFAARDPLEPGKPLGYPIPRSYFQGRYWHLNADPLFRFGFDVRLAALLSDRSSVFPMQFDLSVLLHPVEHVSLLADVGARGRAGGFQETVEDPETPYLREGYLLLHELPYGIYAKGGRFVPSYGLRIPDHTSFVRRRFDLDGALPEVRVTGVEAGASPNYPFLNLSWFETNPATQPPPAFDIFDVGPGWGMAANLGFREVGWFLGGSGMIRRNQEAPEEEADMVGVYGGYNVWRYAPKVPLTLQGEIDQGRFTSASGRKRTARAVLAEADYLLGNGLNLLAKYDWEDPDTEVAQDAASRITVGAQLTPYPGITLDARIRTLFPSGGQADSDIFLQLHLWY